jgi:hypothetical protein
MLFLKIVAVLLVVVVARCVIRRFQGRKYLRMFSSDYAVFCGDSYDYPGVRVYFLESPSSLALLIRGSYNVSISPVDGSWCCFADHITPCAEGLVLSAKNTGDPLAAYSSDPRSVEAACIIIAIPECLVNTNELILECGGERCDIFPDPDPYSFKPVSAPT